MTDHLADARRKLYIAGPMIEFDLAVALGMATYWLTTGGEDR